MPQWRGSPSPLDLSVFVDAGAGFLLATCAEYPFSIDHLRNRGQVRMKLAHMKVVSRL